MRINRMMGALFLSAALAAGAWAQEANVAPTINNNFKSADLDVKSWADRFTGESREVYTARMEVLKAMALKPGDSVADVGAGTGLYTRLFAQAVGPAGKVYANDIAPKFLAFIADNAAREGLKNVQTVQGNDRSTNLPDASVDVIFNSDVYHHFEYPMTMNADMRRALKPGGRLYVLEFEKVPGLSSANTMTHVRAPKEVVIAEITKAGFTLVEQVKVPGLRENYLLHFRKS
jgi:ubiquinone/menaquinone biosynthesis C-methylase UbiE